MGEVVAVFYAKENTEKQDMVVVSFDGIEVTYTRQDLNQITLAYCCSIHKSQGSEFPIVILPIVKSYYRMLRRNLIYTAITRSKQFLIICGEEEALRIGVERADEQTRQTSLCDKLKNISENHEMNSDEEMDNGKLGENENNSNLTYDEMMTSVDPMIGMDGITPYQFME